MEYATPEVRALLESRVEGWVEHRGSVRGRHVAEYVPPGRSLAIKVVYIFGSMAEDEHIVVTVMRGRPSHPEGGEGK